MSLRVFLAIELNHTIQHALDEFQSQITPFLPIKWVSPHSIHLTIKFLGDIADQYVLIIQESLQEVVKTTQPFSLTIKGLGGFPSLQRPRIFWAGVAGEIDHLNVFVACVETAMNTLGFIQEERPYFPHLTLSRIKSHSKEFGKRIETSDVLKQEWVFGHLLVDRLGLFQSRLTPKGARYTKLWELPLQG